jgi:hypothetical protein
MIHQQGDSRHEKKSIPYVLQFDGPFVIANGGVRAIGKRRHRRPRHGQHWSACGRSYERSDLFGTNETGGFSEHTSLVVKEAVGDRVKREEFRLPKTQLPRWTVKKARVIATFEDNSPAIIINRFGKGSVTSIFLDAWTVAKQSPNLIRDVIDQALSSAGTQSQVDIVGANENMDVAVGRTGGGFTVAVVNHNAEKVEVILKHKKSSDGLVGRWVDLVVGDQIQIDATDRSVRLMIQGGGFRALEFRRD